MRTNDLCRRRFLRGAFGGAAISIGLPRLTPMLDDQGRAWAATGSRPIRYITWGFANGVIQSKWNPTTTGTGSAWQLSPALAPLGPWKPYVTVLGNIKVEGSSQHGCGNTFFVTGTPATPKREPLAPSIDQVIAAVTKQHTPLKSLEVGVVDNPEDEAPGRLAWSHNGPGSSNFPSYDVGEVFDRLFGPNGAGAGRTGAPTGGGAPAPVDSAGAALRKSRKSVLDFVRQDAARLRTALPTADRARLDQHLEGIFALERRITVAEMPSAPTMSAPGGTCTTPAIKRMVGGGKFDAQSAEVNQAMAQLVAMAFACDLTRVATVHVTQAGSKAQMPEAGVSDWHELSHDGNEGTIQKVVVRHVEYLAALVKALHDTSDGAGNLLDNTAILTVNDCADGAEHSGTDMPVVIVGKAGGRLIGDVHHRGAPEFTSAVCVTVGRAVTGLQSFGSGSYQRSTPIAAIFK